MPAVHRFAKAHCSCSLGRVWRKKELICPEKDYTLILFGGLALSLIISGFFEGQGIKKQELFGLWLVYYSMGLVLLFFC